MKRTRRSVIRSAVAIGGIAGLSGTALSGETKEEEYEKKKHKKKYKKKKKHEKRYNKKKKYKKKKRQGPKDGECNKFGTKDEQPGQSNGQARGHTNDRGGDSHAHDRGDHDQSDDMPGQRVGHCKYD